MGWGKRASTPGFCHLCGPLSENQRKRKERQVLRPGQRTKKSNGKWEWRWYQLLLSTWKGDAKSWKSEDESIPYRQQHYWDRPEYWEESWRPEETYSHSGFLERPLANAGVKISKECNDNNNNVLINQKKWICQNVDFAVPAEQRVKTKEGEKLEKYQNLTRVPKKMLNMKVTMASVVFEAFGTILKNQEKRKDELEIRKNWNLPDHRSTKRS